MDAENRPAAPKVEVTGRGITFSQYFLLIAALIAMVLFFLVIRIFVVLIVVAAVFATLFYPLYRRLLGRLGNRNLSALACCTILLIGLLIPLAVVGNLVVLQAVELFQEVQPRLQALASGSDSGILGQMRRSPLGRWLNASHFDIQASLQEGMRTFAGVSARLINRASVVTVESVINIIIFYFVLFYFFRDGKRILESIRQVLPVNERYQDDILARFRSISRATVRVTLVIGLIQGTLGALTFLALDIRAWLLWGVVMTVFAIIPVFGAWTVMVPAGLIEIVSGRIWQGIVIILISVLVISVIDNLIRPRLVGRDVGMHDLMIFFSTLGGISMFGFMGFVIGPLIAALFLTLLDIYRTEFKRQLETSHVGAREDISVAVKTPPGAGTT